MIDVREHDIFDLFEKLRAEHLSQTYLRRSKTLLHQAFQKALANHFVMENPVSLTARLSSPRKPPCKKPAFNEKEVKILMEKLPFNRIGNSMRLMLGTGMRVEEMLALQKEDIAEDGSMISINKARIRGDKDTAIGPPKTQSSYREILIPENLRPCAIYLRNIDKTFIWDVKLKGWPCDPKTFEKYFTREVGKIEGVRVLNPSSCRETFISQMQALKVDMPTIQSFTGQTKESTTKSYLRVQQSIKQDAVKQFNEHFCKSIGV